jgi:XTP/dITP diphosphohydrolase
VPRKASQEPEKETAATQDKSVQLVVATGNVGKLREIRAALEGLRIAVIDRRQAGLGEPPDEEGESYLANALGKACWAAQASGQPALGEDSGIEIEALGGEPGVHSSRFLGLEAGDADRNAEILSRLAGVDPSHRGARYRCVVALRWPEGEELVTMGESDGRIALEERGTGGFGYDPIFELPDSAVTMAQLTVQEKGRVSHRGQALRRLAEALTRRGGL